jgi:hypothetical protein
MFCVFGVSKEKTRIKAKKEAQRRHALEKIELPLPEFEEVVYEGLLKSLKLEKLSQEYSSRSCAEHYLELINKAGTAVRTKILKKEENGASKRTGKPLFKWI